MHPEATSLKSYRHMKPVSMSDAEGKYSVLLLLLDSTSPHQCVYTSA